MPVTLPAGPDLFRRSWLAPPWIFGGGFAGAAGWGKGWREVEGEAYALHRFIERLSRALGSPFCGRVLAAPCQNGLAGAGPPARNPALYAPGRRGAGPFPFPGPRSSAAFPERR